MDVLKPRYYLFLLFFLFLFSSVSAKETEIFTTPRGKQVKVAKGKIVVKFKSDTSEEKKKNLHKSAGAEKKGILKKLGVDVVKIKPGNSIQGALNKYKNRSDVLYAEPVYIWEILLLPDEYSTESALASRQWNLANISAPGGWAVESGSGAIIAVIDTGIDINHPELKDNLWVNPSPERVYDPDGYAIRYDTYGWNFVSDNNNPDDDHGHGTHCAGIAGAEAGSAMEIVGVAWHNKLMAVKVMYPKGDGASGETDDIAAGIIYAADMGADVISMSIGSEGPSEIIKDAVDYAYGKGAVLVAASGNGGVDQIGDPQVNYPAAYEHVIAVGAADSADERPSFSNYGGELDFTAPGVEIYSTLAGGTYGDMSGTSMACPHAAGLASLVISFWNRGTNPGWTPEQVKNVILTNCDDIGSAGWDRYTGYGRINMQSTLEYVDSGLVSIDDEKVLIYPNPFDPAFQKAAIVLPKNYNGTIRRVKIFSLDGQIVREETASGRSAFWDGRNDSGDVCASGLYFYYLDTTSGSKRGKITLIR